jgi:hypothetical protein
MHGTMTPWMQGHLQHATPKVLRLPINMISSKRERGDGFGAVTYASNPPEVQRIICVDGMGNVIPAVSWIRSEYLVSV